MAMPVTNWAKPLEEERSFPSGPAVGDRSVANRPPTYVTMRDVRGRKTPFTSRVGQRDGREARGRAARAVEAWPTCASMPTQIPPIRCGRQHLHVGESSSIPEWVAMHGRPHAQKYPQGPAAAPAFAAAHHGIYIEQGLITWAGLQKRGLHRHVVGTF